MKGRFVYGAGRVKQPSGEWYGESFSADSWEDPEGVERLLQTAEKMVRDAAEGKATRHDRLAAEIQADLDVAGLPSAD